MEEDLVVGTYADCEPMPPQGIVACEVKMEDRRPPVITRERRLHLLRLAEKVSAELSDKIKLHERCLFRRMVEMLMTDEHD